jgi:hypothetical protein
MQSACQSFDGRNTRAAARSLARIFCQPILGKISILSALRGSSLFVRSSPFHNVIVLRRSRSYISTLSHTLLTISRRYQQNVDQN